MTFSRLTRLGLAAFIMLLGLSSALGDKKSAGDEMRAKARHFFLKGTIKEAEGNLPEAYEYYKKAYRIDPSYIDASYSFGELRLMLTEDTYNSKDETFKSLALMKPLLETYPGDVEASEKYAYFAMKADSLSEALRVYNRVIKEHPGLSRLYVPQSMLYMSMDSTEQALRALREFERLEGASTETTMRKASFHIAKGDTVAAIREFREYAEAHPDDVDAQIDLAMIYGLMEMPDTAYSILKETEKKHPESGDIKVEVAMMSLERGDTAAFHRYMGEAFRSEDIDDQIKLELLPQYVEKIPSRGYDFKESDQIFKDLEPAFTDNLLFLNYYTNYLLMKNDYEGAARLAEKMFKMDSKNTFLLGKLMSMYVIEGKPQKAMTVFEEYPDGYLKKDFNLSMTYVGASRTAGKDRKALEWLDTLLAEYTPPLQLKDNTVSADSLGKYEEEQLKIASSVFEQAGDIYASQKRNEDAIKSYENAIVMNPDNQSVLNNYAYFIVETLKAAPGSQEFIRAKEMSRKSLENSGSDPEGTYNFYDTYAWILFKEQNYKDALTYQEIAVESAGPYLIGELLSHYGDILFMNGQPEEALKQWKEALKLDPDDKLLKKKVENKTFFYE